MKKYVIVDCCAGELGISKVYDSYEEAQEKLKEIYDDDEDMSDRIEYKSKYKNEVKVYLIDDTEFNYKICEIEI